MIERRPISLAAILIGTMLIGASAKAQDESQGEASSYSVIGGKGPGEAGSLGAGIIIGEPLAFGARYWMTSSFALQAWLGATVLENGLYLGVDALYGFPDVFRTSNGKVRFDLWVGGGVAAGSADGPSGWHCHEDPWPYCHRFEDPARLLLAARVPFGISLMFTQIPLELFIETALGLRFTPNAGAYASGGLGARWYF